MKYYILFLITFYSTLSASQCNCGILPNDSTGKTTLIVSSVEELQAALYECNTNNGNYTILLNDGIYELNNNLLYIGQNMVNLTIRSISGNRDKVVIKGKGMGGNIGYIFNVAADNFTAADMTIGWVSNHAIQIHAEHDADNCLMQNIRFVDTKEQMLKVSGNSSPTYSDSGIVQCCLFEFEDEVAYQYYTGGIDAHRAKDWIVRYNTFKHIRSPDNGLAEHAIHFWSNSKNTIVRNNHIINCDRGVGFGLGNSGHQGGVIAHNFVHTSRDVGIGLENSKDTKIYHNTVITDNYFNSIEYRFQGTYDVHIANNLTNKAITSRNEGTGKVESNHTTTDMSIFLDAFNYDYHLAQNAASITDAGIFLEDIDSDYDCHLLNGIPDIGADEFQSSTNDDFQFVEPLKLKAYPNPLMDVLILEFSDNINKTLHVSIINNFGQTLHSQIIDPNLTKNTFHLSTSTFDSGIYYLLISDGDSTITSTLLKL